MSGYAAGGVLVEGATQVVRCSGPLSHAHALQSQG
jgi:hypothetical protein